MTSLPTPDASEVAALEVALARERALVDAALALAGVGDRARVATIAAAAAVPHLAPWCLIVAGDGRAPPHLGAAHRSPAALPHVQALVDGAYHCVVALAESEDPGSAQPLDAARLRACAADPAQEAALRE